APLLINTAKVEFGGETGYTYVYAVSEDSIEKMFLDMEMYEIKKGRSLRKGDKYEAVIGSLVESGFFTKDVGLRNKIKINDKEFTVVGTLKKVGARDDDSSLYILLDIAREIFNEPESISMIFVKTKRGYDVEEVSKDIEDRLKRSRGNDDFTVTSPTKLMESMSTILGIINMVLIGIAAISLLVGGIGIMNTMYTSVLERTRDIGVMKAVGAKNIDIMLIFLFESGLLGLFGGAVGIILGIGMAKTVEIYANQAGFGMLRASFSIGLILSALVFSFIIGVISGLLPTRKAARMKPVDALRYE
ncbi:MAG: FtsX-like permease family protein, partial [Halobacteria archaeon]